MLAAVAAAIASTETNIDHVSVDERESDTSLLVFELKVRDRKHLARIIRTIRRMPDVQRVTRTLAAHARDDATNRLNDWRLPTMTRKIIHTDRAPKAIGTYSQAVRAGDTVYLSGQIPLDPATMELVTGDIEAEIRRAFENLKAVAEGAGGTLAQAVKVTVFLTDLAHFAKVNEIMATYFTEPYPARAARGRLAAAERGARRDRVRAVPWLRPACSASSAPSNGRSRPCAGSGRRWQSACSASAWRRSRICCSFCRCATRTARR